ncbi:mitochondrial glycoprotein [Suillus fuscotomentosus]|uniref:Mitochondrial glycoprotein n=1 Tax=Suillus fuscotomentosus TaxID=1912939 RepID=A0AAD4EBA9_9AGAM|nr:mitochondrial glycoprotein [Suillus fuscotomentosus]KAG1903114.1 mitochondrial glycoprotein [Suillus fuscotomentosus]
MSVLRALRQVAASSSRAVARPAARSGPLRLATVQLAPRASMTAARAFSASTCRLSEGSTDVVLSQKLAEELKYEKEAVADAPGEPEFLKTFKEQGIWEIQDVTGNDEVTLVRKFGNETIRMMFSIADIQNAEEEPEYEQEEGEGGEEQPPHSYPIRASFSVTKANAKGSINIDTMCQEGAFIIDNMSYYPDAQLGTELTAEADWKRRGLYIGPQFDTLDVSVQEEIEKWLQERGINENLATFVPEYSEFKEQKEYVRWLDNVKNFVDA